MRSGLGGETPRGARELIVTCQECATSFQLDDARIPATGARVRCSRCKHAFFLPHPSASASQAIQAVVEQVVEEKDGRTPEPTRDLGASFRAGRAGKSTHAARVEPEEEDWQFSQEIRSEADDDGEGPVPSHATTPRPDSFDLTGDFGRGFDPGTSDRADAAASPAQPAASPVSEPAPSTTPSEHRSASEKSGPLDVAREEAAFGSIDDFSSLIEDEEVAIDVSSETVPSAPLAARRPSTSQSATDSIRPSASQDRARPAAVAPSSAPGTPKKKTANRARRASAPVLDLFAAADEQEPEAEAPIEFEPAAQRRLARVGHAVGWCITLASIAIVGVLAARPEWTRWQFAPERVELGPFVAQVTRAGWLETSRAGLLFVVEGELRNAGGNVAMPPAARLTLLDVNGKPMPEAVLAIGEPLGEHEVREAAPDVLWAQWDGAAGRWVTRALGAGEVRRFAAIARADDLPPAARRMRLELAPTAAQSGSSPRATGESAP